MPQLISVGEFARLTHLTVKTLHHYHDVGVLTPAAVDPDTGYRRYGLDQLERAQLIRRLRAVRMPVPQVRAVLAAPDDAARHALIAAHLDDLRRQLADTATAVANLQHLLTGDSREPLITFRELPDLPCVLATAEVDRGSIGAWCAEIYPRLFALAGTLGGVGGPGGALYDAGWFEDDRAAVTAYVPLVSPPAAGRPDGASTPDGGGAPDGEPHVGLVPGGRFAIAVHAGAFEDLDRTYAALGGRVTRQRLGAGGPIREVYLVTPSDTTDPAGLRTEVCWPITTVPEETP
jgi:DNA-binding transcriptional MerR regulator